MNPLPVLFAEVELPGVTKAWNHASGGTREMMMLLAAIGVVTLAVLIWAVFIRKRKSERLYRYGHPHRHNRTAGASETAAEAAPGPQRRRRRRRGKAMNPTLAQTGGLPPSRPGDEGQEMVRAE